jgi:DNA polymerase V
MEGQDMAQRTYIAIDLKSFYASVECRERGLDPLDTNLVVADESRTDKTICLAVTPSLKSYGIPGRARLFEVRQRVKEVNAERCYRAPGRKFSGASHLSSKLKADPSLELDFIIARPRMAYYMQYSSRIYSIYMKYVAPEDVVVYSIDEVFMDVTNYMSIYKVSAHDLAMKIILDVLKETGITATAGIGTNLFLCKVAMDIVAKHIPADENGVRIAQLDEMRFRRDLWSHRPITDFWRVGRGYARKLERYGIYTMGDIALCSEKNEDFLYRLFGKNAELLIDHAWGWEPCTIADIKAYKPSANSISSGQVLHCPYDWNKARLVVREMTDLLVLDLVDKDLMTDQMVLTVGYDIENLTDPVRRAHYTGPVETDHYGRRVPKKAHGSINLGGYTSSTRKIMDAVTQLYESIVDRNLLVRRMYVVANHILPRDEAPKKNEVPVQMDLFTDYDALEESRKIEEAELDRENRLQKAAIAIKKRYGKNAILKGMNLEEGATAKDRNAQIGGHKA